MNLLKQHIESLIFSSEQPISLKEISASLKITFGWEAEELDMLNAIEELKSKYQVDDFSFELNEIADGYQFLSKKEYHATISALIQHKAKKRLSIAQMETLAIIAYKQPVSKTEVENIRGVNCDYAVQKLLEKELIEIQGKSDGPGRPIIYKTSESFMEYFGIKSVKDLPQLKDIHPEQNEIGTAVEMMDSETVVAETPETAIASDSEGMAIDIVEVSSETVVAADDIAEEHFTAEESDSSELPDRKSIFLEHNDKMKISDDVKPEISEENE
jgi:segregation and condensation protein B